MLQGAMGVEADEGISLAEAPPLRDLEVAHVAGTLAALLADAHDRGEVHGAVDAARVLVEHDGALRLLPAEEGRTALVRPQPADDVHAWGQIVGHLLLWAEAGADDAWGDLRSRLRRPGRRVRAEPASCRPVLAALADQACDADPACRPSAKAIANAIRHRVPEAVPAAGLAGRRGQPPRPTPAESVEHDADEAGSSHADGAEGAGLEPQGSAGEPTRSRRTGWTPSLGRLVGWGHARALASAGGAVAVVSAVALSTLVLPRPDRPGPAPDDRAPAAGSRTVPPGGECPVVAEPSADADGDGCREPVTPFEGGVVVGTVRYELGGAGDHVVVGDWSCDGQRTPAVLTDGTVAVYDRWPGPGEEVEGRVVASVADGTGLSVRAREGCDVLVVQRHAGGVAVVDPRQP